VNIKQFIGTGTGSYNCNADGITLSMSDFSSLMLTLRSIESKLLTDNVNRSDLPNLGEKPKKNARKSKHT